MAGVSASGGAMSLSRFVWWPWCNAGGLSFCLDPAKQGDALRARRGPRLRGHGLRKHACACACLVIACVRGHEIPRKRRYVVVVKTDTVLVQLTKLKLHGYVATLGLGPDVSQSGRRPGGHHGQ